MKKIMPIIIGLLCICVFAFAFAHVKKAHPIYDNDVDTAVYQSLGLMNNETLVQQRFVCLEDSLDGFYLKTDVIGECRDVTLAITVLDVEAGTVLSENELPAADLKTRKLNYFQIDSVTGCKGRLLEICVQQKNAPEGSGIGLYIQPGETGAYVNGTSANGILVMKQTAERFDMESFLVAGFFCCFIWAFLWFLYRLFR